MDAVQHHRETVQPIREKTGGSTFKNPEGTSAWKEIDKAGCRGLMIGGAQMSPMHCNFMINTGNATGYDLEYLGRDGARARAGAFRHPAAVGDQAHRRLQARPRGARVPGAAALACFGAIIRSTPADLDHDGILRPDAKPYFRARCEARADEPPIERCLKVCPALASNESANRSGINQLLASGINSLILWLQ